MLCKISPNQVKKFHLWNLILNENYNFYTAVLAGRIYQSCQFCTKLFYAKHQFLKIEKDTGKIKQIIL